MIFQRHKILLATLNSAARRPSRIEIMKWLFLLRQESEDLSSDSSFYDFVPYKYGPFSFTLFRDISDLERLGYLKPDSLEFEKELLLEIRSLTSQIPKGIQRAIDFVLAKYGHLATNKLVEYVYEKYPWFASRSEKLNGHNPTREQPAKPAIYTTGYEGESIDRFLQKLLKAGIRGIIDVRNNPVSRKYGFSKGSLNDKCDKQGLVYRHYPELGIPSRDRAKLDSRSDYDNLFDFYIKAILPSTRDPQKDVIGHLRKTPSVLVCFEEDPAFCHRSHLAKALSQNSDLEVVHI